MRYLLVDGHSVIFTLPVLRGFHQRNREFAREELIRRLTAYQDATGIRVVVVFDGKGDKASSDKAPGGIQVFYSGSGQTADDIIERLAANYAREHDITVVTDDLVEQQTVITFGGHAISVESFFTLLADAEADVARRIRQWRKR